MDKQNAHGDLTTASVIGFIEVLNESGIQGWAYDKKNLSRPATLVFHIDDTPICEVICNNTRVDVQSAGHPRDEVGFQVKIPRAYFDDLEHRYHFSTADNDLVHLIRVGMAPRAPTVFRFSTYFDPAFYARFYPDARGMSDLAAFDHWSNLKTDNPRHPNAAALFAALEAAGKPLPPDFSAVLYRFLNPAIAPGIEEDWEAEAHYLLFGQADALLYSFDGNSFLVDLYFGGIPPAVEEMEEFLARKQEALYVSLDDLLSRNGITSDSCLKHLNVADYIAENMELGLKTKVQCIRHFAEVGIKAGQALSFDTAFDPAFVAEFDDGYKLLSAADSYLKWINTGARSGTPPSQTPFLRSLGLSDVSRYPSAFDPNLYMALNPDLKPLLHNRWTVLRHLIEHGLHDGRPGCPISLGTCDIYLAAADRLAVANRLVPARRLYETLLAEDLTNVMGSRHYADCLLRQDEFFLASRTYERSIATGGDNIWTHLNLTTCYLKQNRLADACATMQRISAARPGDRAVQRRYRDVMREAYSKLAAEAQWLAANRFYDKARARIRQACDLLVAPLAPTMVSASRARQPVRSVAIIADIGLPQCKFYRVDQKIEQLEAAGITAAMIDYRGDVLGFVRGSLWTDAVIFYRVPATPDIMWAIWLLRQAGIPIFYEIDDLMFDAGHFPDSFESYGGQISHDLYAELVNGSVSLSAAMSVCDYALASTPALATAMQERVVGQQAFVQRNSLGKLHKASYQTVSTATKRDKVRIFYGSGTKAHNEDFDDHLAEPLARLLKQWGPRLELFIMGYLTLPAVLRPYQKQIVVHAPVWDLRAYWSVLREVDISVAVLKPGTVADCKSEIKWLEAGMLSVPSVVTATQTYAEVIQDETTGVLIHSAKEWFPKLDALVRDEPKRREIGRAAREVALGSYSVPAMAANLNDIFSAITTPHISSRKRILVVNVFYPPQSVGGATRVVADNVNDIQAHYGDEYELQVFTTLEGGAEAYVPLIYLAGDVRVTAVPTPNEPDIDRKVWDARMAAIFERVVADFKPDLVHFHCIQRITLSVCESLRQRTIPYIVTVHDGWWISESQFLVDDYGTINTYDYADPMYEFSRGNANRLERMKVKQTYLAAAERVVAVSESFAAIYRRCGFTNVVALPNGVSALPRLPRVPSPDGRVRLAHIGGASFHKGYHLVRAALCRGSFENLHLLVIDHAMDPSAVQHGIWGKTEVTFRGKFSQTKVAELYSTIDVLLAPSIWPESYGLVAREATLAGCWVVASDRGAIGEDVTAENGFVVDVRSCDAISAVFAEMNDNAAKFLRSVPPATLRTAGQQADDLAVLYRTLLTEVSSPAVFKTKRKAIRLA